LSSTIHTLLAAAPEVAAVAGVAGDGDTAITGIAYDSRQVTPGALFVAWRGAAFDGHRFVGAALDRGAVAILAEEPVADPRARCVVTVPNSRAALAQFAAAFYRDPSRELGLIGVTGTKGKTTTSFLIEAILAQRAQTGLIGTVDLKVGPRRWRNPAHQTTPESLDVQRLLREMVDAGVEWAILETSSHALATYRVDRCAYDIAVITNVTHEHLDFHGTYEEYLEAKATLFDRLAPAGSKAAVHERIAPSAARAGGSPRGAVINRDDPGAATILGRAKGAPELTYGLSEGSHVRAVNVESGDAGLTFTLRTPWGHCPVRTPLLGRFNVYNALAAAGACLLAGLPPEAIAAGLASFAGVPGRVQRIDRGQPFLVVVDFAHNADSLDQILTLLRGVTKGRIIALFGSGGERDLAKRPAMGAVCARLADFGIFADEDPRGEDPLAILHQIAAGAIAEGWREGRDYVCVPDRQGAIDLAFALARPGDAVLLAGKGHENSIIYADRTIPWDEAAEARRALAALGYGEGDE
jgi:UDP-N-acetylmuramoyl-L-alanyl-D-glutamate--2,6-diaminopimelate ligase